MNVIEVKGLSKKYRIGRAEKRSDTLMGALMEGIKSPLRNLRQIQGLTRLEDEDDSINWALRDVSFEVKEGEVLGIIGHNGAGKSTLLKILSRITEPSEGEVHIHGRVAALLEVGTGFHPELTGRENIYMNGTILGMRKKEIDRKLDEIVDFSGVEKYLNTPVKFYSSGMRVRLGFSVAAHLEPEILIIDEVLAVGDAEFQKKCLGKMENVAEQGRTVLFVSHNMSAVTTLCKAGLVLKGGKVQLIGTALTAVDSYLNQFSSTVTCVNYADDVAPGNSEARFISAKVFVADDQHNEMREGDSLIFEFVFRYLNNERVQLDVTFHLTDEYGNLLFVGSSAFMPEDHLFESGIVGFACRVPADLLQHGRYTVSKLILIRNRGVSILGITDVLSFEVRPRSAGYLGWMAQKEGLIKPKLNWTVIND